jgi:outer membrane protein insertion porin family
MAIDRRQVRIAALAPAAGLLLAAGLLFAVAAWGTVAEPTGAAARAAPSAPAEGASGANAAPAPTVRSVSVEGHESVSTREVASIVAGGEGAPFDRAAVEAGVDSLVSRLAALGRPFARVDVAWAPVGDGVEIAVRVEEGPEVTLGSVSFEGVEAIDLARTMSRAASRAGSPVRTGAVEADIEALLSAYDEAGRPFAAVAPRSAALDPDHRVSLSLAVDEGVEVRLDGIVVSGNTATREGVVTRESGLAPGDVVTASRLARIRPRLERLGIFASVSEPVVAVDPSTGLATVGIDVAERPTNSIEGALGYAPTDEGDGEVTGRVEVALGNIAGTGRRASVDWVRPRPRETRIGFSYWEPWLLGAPIDVGVQGLQTVNDTIYTTTEGDLLVSARAGERVRVTWSVGAERYVPGGPLESTTTSVRTSVGASYDGTDVPGNPGSGVAAEAVIEYAAKEEADGGEEASAGTARLFAGAYFRVRPRQVLALEGRLAGIESTEDDVPFHELLVLGGADNLRGYREEQFRGTRTAVGTLEYRYILGRRSRAVAFVDVGYFYRGGANSAKDTKLGYGIGLRGETRLGTISLDYGLGEGDGLLDGKLHVGLIRGF